MSKGTPEEIQCERFCRRAAVRAPRAATPPSAASNSRRPMVTVIRPSRARCVKATIPRHERAVPNSAAPGAGGAQRARWRLETLTMLEGLQEHARVLEASDDSRLLLVPQEPPVCCGPSRPPSSSQRPSLRCSLFEVDLSAAELLDRVPPGSRGGSDSILPPANRIKLVAQIPCTVAFALSLGAVWKEHVFPRRHAEVHELGLSFERRLR